MQAKTRIPGCSCPLLRATTNRSPTKACLTLAAPGTRHTRSTHTFIKPPTSCITILHTSTSCFCPGATGDIADCERQNGVYLQCQSICSRVQHVLRDDGELGRISIVAGYHRRRFDLSTLR